MVKQKKESGKVSKERKQTILFIGVILMIIIITLMITAKPNYTELEQKSKKLIGENSKLEVLEFSDLECPACAQIHPLAKEVFEKYEKEISFEMKHFPLYSIHKKAEIAHMASECVLEIQNKEKFYEYVDLIFENQNNMLKSNLKNLAYSLGVEKDRFDKCLDSDSKKDNVRKEYEEGLEKGVGATPTFFVNGKKVSFPDLESEIKNILNKTNE